MRKEGGGRGVGVDLGSVRVVSGAILRGVGASERKDGGGDEGRRGGGIGKRRCLTIWKTQRGKKRGIDCQFDEARRPRSSRRLTYRSSLSTGLDRLLLLQQVKT